jgi:hypothetical protein
MAKATAGAPKPQAGARAVGDAAFYGAAEPCVGEAEAAVTGLGADAVQDCHACGSLGQRLAPVGADIRHPQVSGPRLKGRKS